MLKLTVFWTVIATCLLGGVHSEQSLNLDIESLIESLQKEVQVDKGEEEAQLDDDNDDDDVYGTLRSDEVEQLINLAKEDADNDENNQQLRLNDKENQVEAENKLLQQLSLLKKIQERPSNVKKVAYSKSAQNKLSSNLLYKSKNILNVNNKDDNDDSVENLQESLSKLKDESLSTSAKRKILSNLLYNNKNLLDVNNNRDDDDDRNKNFQETLSQLKKDAYSKLAKKKLSNNLLFNSKNLLDVNNRDDDDSDKKLQETLSQLKKESYSKSASKVLSSNLQNLLADVNNRDEDNDNDEDGNDLERNYSNIYLVLNPEAVEKSQNKDKLNDLLTNLLQPNQKKEKRKEFRYKGFSMRNDDDLLNRRRWEGDSMEGPRRPRNRGGYPSGTAIPHLRNRGNIYEKD